MKDRKFKKSMRIKIALFYVLLASMNMVIFSVLIYDQQMSILMQNFNLSSRDLVQTVLGDIQDIKISRNKDQNFKELMKGLRVYNIRRYRIFDSEGNVWHKEPESQEGRVDDYLLRKTLEISGDSSIFRAKYHVELDSKNFDSMVLLPLESTEKNQKLFLDLSLSLEKVTESLKELYLTLGFGISFGVVLHVLFGLYVYQLIFVRVSLLKKSSGEMAEGDLKTRVAWKMNREDELDDMGNAFNMMAEKIENQFETVTRLNREIQNELEIGKEVQSVFLTGSAFLAEYNPAILYLPMREVSGDVYSFFYYQNGNKGLFFADATGHGVSAALVTTITLMSLDSILREEKGVQVGAILNKLNDLLSLKLEASFFATAVLIRFDTDMTLTFSNAGHNSPLLIKGEDRVIEFPQSGPPLGMIDDFSYQVKKARLDSGDRLIIYSDGVVEATDSSNNMYTLDRLKNITLANRHESNENLKNIIYSDLEEFTEGVYRDDVSMIILEIP